MIKEFAHRLVLALPLSLVWLGLTGRVSLESWGVGLFISLLLVTILEWQGIGVRLRFTPETLVTLTVYTLILLRDIFWSSIDVAWRIMQPKMPLKPGIIAVPTFEEHEAITAMSAHGITITPGQLVVDFDSDDIMYVHCLDVEASAATIEADQHKRLKYLRKIWGVDDDEVRLQQITARVSLLQARRSESAAD